MILVTGAAGKTGRAIIRKLAAAGKAVRGFAHRERQSETILTAGAQEVITGSMLDEAAVQIAITGATAVYHICPNMHPDEIRIGKIAISSAVNAGVRQFVYHSVLHPQTEAMPHHWQKLRVEELLLASGLPFTILQPAAYMQNLLPQWPQIQDEGIYKVPYDVTARIALIDLEDLAEAAAIVLTTSGHFGATYSLSGPDNLNQIEIAGKFSNYLRKKVSASKISLVQWQKQAQNAGLGDYQIKTLSENVPVL